MSKRNYGKPILTSTCPCGLDCPNSIACQRSWSPNQAQISEGEVCKRYQEKCTFGCVTISGEIFLNVGQLGLDMFCTFTFFFHHLSTLNYCRISIVPMLIFFIIFLLLGTNASSPYAYFFHHLSTLNYYRMLVFLMIIFFITFIFSTTIEC